MEGRVQRRRRGDDGKGKEGRGSEGGKERREMQRLAIPILVCFRRRVGQLDTRDTHSGCATARRAEILNLHHREENTYKTMCIIYVQSFLLYLVSIVTFKPSLRQYLRYGGERRREASVWVWGIVRFNVPRNTF